MDKKLQQAIFIRDNIEQKKRIIEALSDENYMNIWEDTAYDLPLYGDPSFEPSYLQMLSAMDSMEENLEDAPIGTLDDLRNFLSEKITQETENVIDFLELRIESLEENIEHLILKFKADWGEDYTKVLNQPIGRRIRNNKQFNLDDILDKINESGIKSLTKKEKEFLDSKADKGNDKVQRLINNKRDIYTKAHEEVEKIMNLDEDSNFEEILKFSSKTIDKNSKYDYYIHMNTLFLDFILSNEKSEIAYKCREIIANILKNINT